MISPNSFMTRNNIDNTINVTSQALIITKYVLLVLIILIVIACIYFVYNKLTTKKDNITRIAYEQQKQHMQNQQNYALHQQQLQNQQNESRQQQNNE